jgi:hypothetical protein
MATAAELRDEARHVRVLALEIVTDAVVQAELQALIDELEARALEGTAPDRETLRASCLRCWSGVPDASGRHREGPCCCLTLYELRQDASAAE